MTKATQNRSPNHDSRSEYINLGVLSHIESRFIPRAGTQARQLLGLLKDGLSRSTHEVTLMLGVSPRSALQALSNDNNGYWSIINGGGNSKDGKYRLDPRHLSAIAGDDARARAEREVALKESSSNKANNGESTAQVKREKLAVAKSKLGDTKEGDL